MKKVIAAAAWVWVAGYATGQTRIAVKAGPNISTARVTLSEAKQTTSYKPGFSCAVQLDVPFDGPLHFSPSIGYNLRSFKTNYTDSRIIENTIHYLSLAPNLSLQFPAGSDTRSVSLGFGPVLGITNFGKEKITLGSTTITRNMTFGYGNYGWFDLGLSTSIAYRINKVFVEATYYHGLSNLNNNVEEDGINLRNRTLGINIGYYFR